VRFFVFKVVYKIKIALDVFHKLTKRNKGNQEWDNGQLLFRCLQARDQYTSDHSLIVALKAYEISFHLDLDPEEMFLAGLMHDIGKIAMHDNILKSDRKLTLEDRESLKEHVIEGVNLLHDAAFSKPIIDFCKYHHERLNGEGYPNKTDDIPLIGRLAAIVDVYSALTVPRVYQKKSYSPVDAVHILYEEQHRKQGYDAYILDLLVNQVENEESKMTNTIQL